MDPLREVFNAPSSDFSCERRETSVVTPQAFALFNSPVVHTRALALAVAVSETNSSDEEKIQLCFLKTLQRRATVDELRACLEHWEEIAIHMDSQALDVSPAPVLEVQRTAVEENTGERFVFREQLFENREFVPDLDYSQIDPRTRALADVCLVLFNCSEFLHID